MKLRRIILTLILAMALGVVADSTTVFNRACSVTGGSAQRMSTVLSTCGYTGNPVLAEYTILNPSTSTNSVFVGQSDVDATNGYELEPGTTSTRRSFGSSDPIESNRIYLFVATTQNVHFSIRGR